MIAFSEVTRRRAPCGEYCQVCNPQHVIGQVWGYNYLEEHFRRNPTLTCEAGGNGPIGQVDWISCSVEAGKPMQTTPRQLGFSCPAYNAVVVARLRYIKALVETGVIDIDNLEPGDDVRLGDPISWRQHDGKLAFGLAKGGYYRNIGLRFPEIYQQTWVGVRPKAPDYRYWILSSETFKPELPGTLPASRG